jgi:hypothetical protein
VRGVYQIIDSAITGQNNEMDEGGRQMKIRLQYVLIVISIFLLSSTANASDKKLLEAVKAMEQKYEMKVTDSFDRSESLKLAQRRPESYISCGPLTISPDGGAVAWCWRPFPYQNEKIPFVTMKSLKEGEQVVWVEGRIAAGSIGISSSADVVVAISVPLNPLPDSRRELLAIDRRSGGVVHNLTRFVREFLLGDNSEDISVSGEGNLVALSTRDYIQVLDIPSGKTLFTGAGRFPRLSPDGKRLAFVSKEKLWIHTFANGSTAPLPIKRVKGIGGWSPDGRFLLAGAWIRPMFLAWEKRQIIVDTTSGEYAVIGTLGEGDYGNDFAWISTKLLADTPQHQ